MGGLLTINNVQTMLALKTLPIDAYRLVFINGCYNAHHSDSMYPFRVDHIKTVTMPNINASAINSEFFSRLTDAAIHNKTVVHIPACKKLDKPLYFVFLNTGEEDSAISSCVCLTIGSEANVSAIEQHISQDSAFGVTLSRMITHVEDDAHYSHIKLIEEGKQQLHFGHNALSLSQYSRAESQTLMLNGEFIQHHTSAEFLREGGELTIDSLALPGNKQTYDFRTFLLHKAPHCRSRQLHKIIAGKEANGLFDGMIKVEKYALKTDAQMDNHNLLTDHQAEVNSKPTLEIYADDVKCSHGSTTGQISAEQIYYLQTRGIPKAQAQHLIINAFAHEISDRIEDDKVKIRVKEKIDSRLSSCLHPEEHSVR
ncbi:Fe-S cluster assembly protein SufD [Vibrio sp. HA2012]|uniref:Fe-S cluster assembly protein SufD n=1 Tax=Vibrio sp. HA2012 TaxID=1971595 RepID=UPI000C2C9CFE|nr:Fe-S cluster assembly protein SufD [Vibrio sp. HA2012]PJC87721.1 Fe-S cluster assembly protein SufD [Vibrio sp. HA2012]